MFGKANSFHDDKEVLPEVLEWHADLRSWARRSDCITESVLDLLDRHMLVANPSSRVKIQEVCSEIDSIINQREPRSGPLSLQLRRAPGPRLFFPESPRSTVGEPLNVVHSHDSDRKSLVSAPKLQERVLTLAKRDSSPSLGADTSPSSITAEDVVLNPRSSGNRSGSTRLPPRSEVRSLKAQRSPSRRLRTSRGSLYQTVFQVQEEMQRTKKNALNHFSIRGRTYPRDDILSRYLYTRDLVG